jgi:hypothetical protein
MEVDPFTLAGFCFCGIGILVEHFHFQAGLQERISKMETKIDLFWGALEDKLPDMLMKGNPISKDSELFKMLECKLNGNLSAVGRERLIELLELEIKKKEHTAGEEVAMLLMALSLKQKAVQ